MHSTTALPEGYREYDHVNLQEDQKTALRVNLAAVIVLIVFIIVGHAAFVPMTEMFDSSGSFGSSMLRFAILLVAYLAYIVLHELTHAAVMKLCGAAKLRFGFTGLYAYAGSEADYFSKSAYLLIALTPLVLWGIVFMVPLFLVPSGWFWTFYFLQLGNVAGAVGDIYVALRFCRMPKDILVRDTGVEMFVYSTHAAKE